MSETIRVMSEEHKDMGGYKVIDKDQFNPEIHTEWKESGSETSTPPEDDFSQMGTAEMKALLDSLDIKYRANASDDNLRALLREANAQTA